jgi:hypothetical protein
MQAERITLHHSRARELAWKTFDRLLVALRPKRFSGGKCYEDHPKSKFHAGSRASSPKIAEARLTNSSRTRFERNHFKASRAVVAGVGTDGLVAALDPRSRNRNKMALELKSVCEKCRAALAPSGLGYICSYECTLCVSCARQMQLACPNCQGDLMPLPRRKEPSTSRDRVGA